MRSIKIRTARGADADLVRGVHLAAFPAGEGELVARLAVELLTAETSPAALSLLAEEEGEVVGHVAFSPVTERGTGEPLGFLLAPLGVIPASQRRGIGSGLIAEGIGRLAAGEAGILLVYGDPAYYGRFGFRGDLAEAYLPPYGLRYPEGWQGIALGAGSGRRAAVRIGCVPALSDPALW